MAGVLNCSAVVSLLTNNENINTAFYGGFDPLSRVKTVQLVVLEREYFLFYLRRRAALFQSGSHSQVGRELAYHPKDLCSIPDVSI